MVNSYAAACGGPLAAPPAPPAAPPIERITDCNMADCSASRCKPDSVVFCTPSSACEAGNSLVRRCSDVRMALYAGLPLTALDSIFSSMPIAVRASEATIMWSPGLPDGALTGEAPIGGCPVNDAGCALGSG